MTSFAKECAPASPMTQSLIARRLTLLFVRKADEIAAAPYGPILFESKRMSVRYKEEAITFARETAPWERRPQTPAQVGRKPAEAARLGERRERNRERGAGRKKKKTHPAKRLGVVAQLVHQPGPPRDLERLPHRQVLEGLAGR